MCTVRRSTLSISSEYLFFCETFPCFVSDGSGSPLFRACQFFHKLVGFLDVLFLQVFFDTLALFFIPCLLCFPRAFFFLTCWLASLCSFTRSSVFFFCFNFLRLSHSFCMSSVTEGFFVGRCVPRMSLAVSKQTFLLSLLGNFQQCWGP